MLNEHERARFNELRNRRTAGGTLTEEEAAEVDEYVRRIEEHEAQYLTPATALLQQKNREGAARLQEMEELLAREERFLERVQQMFDELQQEKQYIEATRKRLVSAA